MKVMPSSRTVFSSRSASSSLICGPAGGPLSSHGPEPQDRYLQACAAERAPRQLSHPVTS